MYARTHDRLAAASLVLLASLAAAITADLGGSAATLGTHRTGSVVPAAGLPVTELPEIVIIGRRENA